MTVRQLAKSLNLKIQTNAKNLDGEVEGCYCGDLLSWVMSRIQKGDAWVTVMGNVNTVAVASLAEASCLVLAEGASLDAQAQEKADANGVAVLSSEESAARLVCEISAAISG